MGGRKGWRDGNDLGCCCEISRSSGMWMADKRMKKKKPAK